MHSSYQILSSTASLAPAEELSITSKIEELFTASKPIIPCEAVTEIELPCMRREDRTLINLKKAFQSKGLKVFQEDGSVDFKALNSKALPEITEDEITNLGKLKDFPIELFENFATTIKELLAAINAKIAHRRKLSPNSLYLMGSTVASLIPAYFKRSLIKLEIDPLFIMSEKEWNEFEESLMHTPDIDLHWNFPNSDPGSIYQITHSISNLLTKKFHASDKATKKSVIKGLNKKLITPIRQTRVTERIMRSAFNSFLFFRDLGKDKSGSLLLIGLGNQKTKCLDLAFKKPVADLKDFWSSADSAGLDFSGTIKNFTDAWAYVVSILTGRFIPNTKNIIARDFPRLLSKMMKGKLSFSSKADKAICKAFPPEKVFSQFDTFVHNHHRDQPEAKLALALNGLFVAKKFECIELAESIKDYIKKIDATHLKNTPLFSIIESFHKEEPFNQFYASFQWIALLGLITAAPKTAITLDNSNQLLWQMQFPCEGQNVYSLFPVNAEQMFTHISMASPLMKHPNYTLSDKEIPVPASFITTMRAGAQKLIYSSKDDSLNRNGRFLLSALDYVFEPTKKEKAIIDLVFLSREDQKMSGALPLSHTKQTIDDQIKEWMNSDNLALQNGALTLWEYTSTKNVDPFELFSRMVKNKNPKAIALMHYATSSWLSDIEEILQTKKVYSLTTYSQFWNKLDRSLVPQMKSPKSILRVLERDLITGTLPTVISSLYALPKSQHQNDLAFVIPIWKQLIKKINPDNVHFMIRKGAASGYAALFKNDDFISTYLPKEKSPSVIESVNPTKAVTSNIAKTFEFLDLGLLEESATTDRVKFNLQFLESILKSGSNEQIHRFLNTIPQDLWKEETLIAGILPIIERLKEYNQSTVDICLTLYKQKQLRLVVESVCLKWIGNNAIDFSLLNKEISIQLFDLLYKIQHKSDGITKLLTHTCLQNKTLLKKFGFQILSLLKTDNSAFCLVYNSHLHNFGPIQHPHVIDVFNRMLNENPSDLRLDSLWGSLRIDYTLSREALHNWLPSLIRANHFEKALFILSKYVKRNWKNISTEKGDPLLVEFLKKFMPMISKSKEKSTILLNLIEVLPVNPAYLNLIYPCISPVKGDVGARILQTLKNSDNTHLGGIDRLTNTLLKECPEEELFYYQDILLGNWEIDHEVAAGIGKKLLDSSDQKMKKLGWKIILNCPKANKEVFLQALSSAKNSAVEFLPFVLNSPHLNNFSSLPDSIKKIVLEIYIEGLSTAYIKNPDKEITNLVECLKCSSEETRTGLNLNKLSRWYSHPVLFEYLLSLLADKATSKHGDLALSDLLNGAPFYYKFPESVQQKIEKLWLNKEQRDTKTALAILNILPLDAADSPTDTIYSSIVFLFNKQPTAIRDNEICGKWMKQIIPSISEARKSQFAKMAVKAKLLSPKVYLPLFENLEQLVRSRELFQSAKECATMYIESAPATSMQFLEKEKLHTKRLLKRLVALEIILEDKPIHASGKIPITLDEDQRNAVQKLRKIDALFEHSSLIEKNANQYYEIKLYNEISSILIQHVNTNLFANRLHFALEQLCKFLSAITKKALPDRTISTLSKSDPSHTSAEDLSFIKMDLTDFEGKSDWVDKEMICKFVEDIAFLVGHDTKEVFNFDQLMRDLKLSNQFEPSFLEICKFIAAKRNIKLFSGNFKEPAELLNKTIEKCLLKTTKNWLQSHTVVYKLIQAYNDLVKIKSTPIPSILLKLVLVLSEFYKNLGLSNDTCIRTLNDKSTLDSALTLYLESSMIVMETKMNSLCKMAPSELATSREFLSFMRLTTLSHYFMACISPSHKLISKCFKTYINGLRTLFTIPSWLDLGKTCFPTIDAFDETKPDEVDAIAQILSLTIGCFSFYFDYKLIDRELFTEVKAVMVLIEKKFASFDSASTKAYPSLKRGSLFFLTELFHSTSAVADLRKRIKEVNELISHSNLFNLARVYIWDTAAKTRDVKSQVLKAKPETAEVESETILELLQHILTPFILHTKDKNEDEIDRDLLNDMMALLSTVGKKVAEVPKKSGNEIKLAVFSIIKKMNDCYTKACFMKVISTWKPNIK